MLFNLRKFNLSNLQILLNFKLNFQVSSLVRLKKSITKYLKVVIFSLEITLEFSWNCMLFT